MLESLNYLRLDISSRFDDKFLLCVCIHFIDRAVMKGLFCNFEVWLNFDVLCFLNRTSRRLETIVARR